MKMTSRPIRDTLRTQDSRAKDLPFSPHEHERINIKAYGRVRRRLSWDFSDIGLHIEGGVNIKIKPNSDTFKAFEFQNVYSMDSSNDDVFNYMIEPLVSQVLLGKDALVIAYGQMGSGKTYSLLGDENQTVIGFVPKIFQRLSKSSSVVDNGYPLLNHTVPTLTTSNCLIYSIHKTRNANGTRKLETNL